MKFRTLSTFSSDTRLPFSLRLDPELGHQPLLGLAFYRCDHLDVALEGRASQLRGKQVVYLKDPGGVVHLDLDLHRALGAGRDGDLVDRRRGDRVDPDLSRV